MKLLVEAVIGHFGKDKYCIDLRYESAGSDRFAVPPTGIQDAELKKAACHFSSRMTLGGKNIRDSAVYYDSTTTCSCAKATSMQMCDGKRTNTNAILAYFDGLTLDELNQVLETLKRAAEHPSVGGKLMCSGLIHEDAIKSA